MLTRDGKNSSGMWNAVFSSLISRGSFFLSSHIYFLPLFDFVSFISHQGFDSLLFSHAKEFVAIHSKCLSTASKCPTVFP